jgi:hypothetical protein
MAALFHVRPWEHDLLSVWEYFRLTADIDRTEEAQK